MRNEGGQLLELQYGNVRNITFHYNNKKYEFDPNGMFTDEGVPLRLKYFSTAPATSSLISKVRDLGKSVVEAYAPDSTRYIVTLHNNTDKAFSIYDYLPGKPLEKTALQVHINKDMDPDDLLLVTELWFFNYLKERNINSVYQNINGPNDGSLSVYAQLNGIPYVNIEIQHGHFEEQRRLIGVVSEMIKSKTTYKYVSNKIGDCAKFSDHANPFLYMDESKFL